MQRYVTLLLLSALLATSCGGDDTATTTAAPTTTAATGDDIPAASDNTGTGEGLAAEGDTVAVHYTGTLDDGTQFDSSRGRDPLSFLVGSDQVIKGFDDAVRGMAIGDVVSVRIPPEEAYGEVDPELIFSVPIEEAPADVAAGDEVLIGGVTTGFVREVTETEVVIDTNHRFAGQALTFEIELVSLTN